MSISRMLGNLGLGIGALPWRNFGHTLGLHGEIFGIHLDFLTRAYDGMIHEAYIYIFHAL